MSTVLVARSRAASAAFTEAIWSGRSEPSSAPHQSLSRPATSSVTNSAWAPASWAARASATGSAPSARWASTALPRAAAVTGPSPTSTKGSRLRPSVSVPPDCTTVSPTPLTSNCGLPSRHTVRYSKLPCVTLSVGAAKTLSYVTGTWTASKRSEPFALRSYSMTNCRVSVRCRTFAAIS